eukprot:m.70745 g.70745  ORF g.70745 m.70745 type:complete len:389 (-) comp12161_c0_seq4:144-1310(-)
MANWFVTVFIIALFQIGEARKSTISNSLPKLDTNNNTVDAHSGNVLYFKGKYFLYGENYGPGNYVVSGSTTLPRLVVYTSEDMVTWDFGGFLHNNTTPLWKDTGLWYNYPLGTWWCPWAVHDKNTDKIVLWFTATPGSCCDAYWGVAESSDGIHFTLISLNETASIKTSLDGSAVFIDDDGKGYVAYSAMQAPGVQDHRVAIDLLASDYRSSAKVTVGSMFPDSFVEGVMLFKRKGIYYVIYGSCCCACREGSGAVVYSATNISGPWIRQSRDVNCNIDTPICAGMPGRNRPQNGLIIPAQGIALSVIPTSIPGENTYMWAGERWLSGPNNPPKCETLCQADTGDCHEPSNYDKGADFMYWIPLDFDANGTIQQFDPFVDTWEIDLAN